MKSIKKKSEEHLNSVYAGYDDVFKELVKESYVSGANYVLDAIQSCIDRHEDGCLALEAIILTIDELKRNKQ